MPEFDLRGLTETRRDAAQADVAANANAQHIALMTTDPHAALRDTVLHAVLRGAGESDPAVRNAAAERAEVPADLRTLVDKIHDHAYKVTDEDIARLQPRYGDDPLFEIVVSAALGASRRRLLAGLAVLDRA